MVRRVRRAADARDPARGPWRSGPAGARRRSSVCRCRSDISVSPVAVSAASTILVPSGSATAEQLGVRECGPAAPPRHRDVQLGLGVLGDHRHPAGHRAAAAVAPHRRPVEVRPCPHRAGPLRPAVFSSDDLPDPFGPQQAHRAPGLRFHRDTVEHQAGPTWRPPDVHRSQAHAGHPLRRSRITANAGTPSSAVKPPRWATPGARKRCGPTCPPTP